MNARKSSKKLSRYVSRQVKAFTWDDLIEMAKANMERNQARILQLQATIRYFKGRKAAGEPCPAALD
jgi:hypothetical protein